MVHGAFCFVHGAWCMAHGAWCMVMSMMHGAWCMVHGTSSNKESQKQCKGSFTSVSHRIYSKFMRKCKGTYPSRSMRIFNRFPTILGAWCMVPGASFNWGLIVKINGIFTSMLRWLYDDVIKKCKGSCPSSSNCLCQYISSTNSCMVQCVWCMLPNALCMVPSVRCIVHLLINTWSWRRGKRTMAIILHWL